MQLHDVRTADLSNKKRRRKGRGPSSGRGKTCGRGREGATSRSGWSMKPTYEGGQMSLFRRLPKRGFSNGPFKEEFAVVNVALLSAFEAGTKVGRDELRAKGLLRGGKDLPIKILGNGDLAIGVTVVAEKFSRSAVEKIEKAGGQVEWSRGVPKKPAPNFQKIAKEQALAKKLESLTAKKKPAGKAKKGEAKEKGVTKEQGGAKAKGGKKEKEKGKGKGSKK